MSNFALRRFVSRRRLAASTASVVFCVAIDSVAQQAASAEALFRQAREEFKSGDLEAACPRFAAAYALDPTVGTLLNLAACDEMTGNLAGAWERYCEAREYLDPDDARARLVVDAIETLKSRVPFVSFQSEENSPSGMALRIDDVDYGSAAFGTELPLNSGAHSVVVLAPERRPRTYNLSLVEGRKYTVLVAPGEPLAPRQSPPLLEAEGRRTSPPPKKTKPSIRNLAPEAALAQGESLPTSFWAAGVVGAVGIVAGTISGVLAWKKKEEADAECTSSGFCSDSGYSATSAGRHYATVSTASFAVGIAGGLLATLIWNDSFDTAAQGHAAVWLRPTRSPAIVEYGTEF
jgi:hypothetical protein